MAEYIERESFIADQRHLYCENCERRKGMKNGKMKFVYAIGEAPCRACEIGDMLDSIESYPAVDVVPVVRCRDCEIHGHCVTEDAFSLSGIRNPFCCAGKRKDGDGEWLST